MDDRTEHDHPQEPGGALPLSSATTVRTRRPAALWAVLAAVAVVVGAVAVNAGSDDAAAPALPVALGAGGRSTEAAMADSSMLAWISYVAGDGLPALGGEAAAYRLAGPVDEAEVGELARALGLEGPVSRAGGGWSVIDDAGSLDVMESRGGEWYFFSTSGGLAGGGTSGCDPDAGDVACTPTTFVEQGRAIEGSSGGSTDIVECTPNDGPAECITGECPPGEPCATAGGPGCTPEECGLGDPVPLPEPRPIPPMPAVDLPAEAEARQIALDLLARTGMAVDDAIVTVEGPYDAWYITVEPRVDGLPSGLLSSVSVGHEGAISSANGFLATPERLGSYPILDTRGAIERANAGFDDLGGGFRDDVMIDDVSDGYSGDVGIGGTGSTDTTTGGDITCEALTPECGYPGVHTCEVQPDGTEICEVTPCPPSTTHPGENPSADPCPPSAGVDIVCPELTPMPGDAGTDGSTGAADAATGDVDHPLDVVCEPPVGAPEPQLPDSGLPMPEPTPLEVVLVAAEPALQLLGAVDGSPDAYLVPAYRFTAEDGSTVDLPAVADEALTGPTSPGSTDTGSPDTAVPPPDTGQPVDPRPTDPCEILVEDDGSGTTHTIQPAPDCDPQGAVALGVPYDVEVISHCGHIADHDGRWWSTVDVVTDLGVGSGTLTLETRDLGRFAGGGLTAEFEARGPAGDYPGCD